MKKILLLVVFLIFQNQIVAQIENPNFTAKQKNEIKILSKSLSFLPDFTKLTKKLTNSNYNKLQKCTVVKSGGIKTSLIELWLNDNWVNSMLTTFAFDLNNHETGYLIQKWQNNDWVNDIDEGIVLNEQNFPQIDSLRSWEDNKWVNQFKHIYTYNSNNDVKNAITMQWNDTTKTWVKMVNLTLNYDEEFKVIESLMEIWDDTNWTPIIKGNYVYNDFDSLKISLTQMWMGDEYIDNERITYKYNEKKLKVEELYENWLFFQSAWAKSLRYKYEYNNSGQQIVKYDEQWDLATGDKKVYKKISTTYTGKYIAEELTQEWKDTDWVNTDLNTYTYNDNKMTKNLWQKWDDTNNKWYNFERWTFTYGNTVAVREKKNEPGNFYLSQNYPNPFNPATTIKYTIPSSAVANVAADFSQRLTTLKVYDVLGRKVTTLVNEEKQPGSYQVIFNANNLPSGIYLYRLRIGNNTITKKCLLIK